MRLLLAAAWLATVGVAPAAPFTPGDHEFSLTHKQLRRSYIVHVPPRAAAGKPLPVVLWQLTGAGHVWPGGQQNYLSLMLGAGTAVIDANSGIWRFFSRFRREKN